MSQEIHGTVADGFEAVREEFAVVAAGERPDHESQVCVHLNGRRVVDLWTGGIGPDTLYGVHEATQGATFLVVAVLVQEGTLELDRRVTYYWPEFAAEGKGGLTLRDLVTHRAGVVGVDGGFTLAELADDRALAERLADQRPFWRAGTLCGSHPLVIGALVGEVVRRATGHRLQQVYEEGSALRTRWTSTWGCRRPRNPGSGPCNRWCPRPPSRCGWTHGPPARTPWRRSPSTTASPARRVRPDRPCCPTSG